MNKLFFVIFFLLVAHTALAQDKEIIIKGVLIDSVQSVVIEDVHIFISSENSEISDFKSQQGGIFYKKIDALSTKEMQVVLSHLNYETVIRRIDITENSLVYDLGEIFMVPKDNIIDEVVVTGRKRVLSRKIDRIAYDVQNDPDKNVESLYDLIQKVPLITIDGLDGVAVKGSKNFRILVNGRESVLFAQNPSQAMKSLQASEIERIEVITNPPAKYDAEGISSLINIITKKQVDNGYNVSLAALYNFPYGPMVNLHSVYKVNKLHISLIGSVFNQRISALPTFSETTYKNQDTKLFQNGSQKFKGNSVTLSGNIAYELDSLNLLSFGLSNRKNDFDRKVNTSSDFSDQNNLSYIYQDGRFDWVTTSLDLNYQKTFKQNSAQLLQFSYRYVNTSNDENNVLDFQNSDIIIREQQNQFGSDEHSIQVDYEQPFKIFSIESGLKYIRRMNKSTFTDLSMGDFDIFRYDYNILNLYHTFELEKNTWSFKGGGRLDVASYPKRYQSTADVNILPSLSVQKTLNEKSALNLSYNKRITRPNILQLNPFVDRSNDYFLNTGNPLLKPVTGHSANISYNYFNKINLYADMGYSFTNNSIENVLEQMSDNIFVFKFLNIGKRKDFNSNINIGFSYRKMRFTLNSAISYIDLNGDYNGFEMSNRGWKSNSSFIFSTEAPYKVRAGVNIRYNTPDIMLQGKTFHYLNSSFSLSKQMFNESFRVFTSINNPFSKYYDDKSYYNTAFANSYSVSKMHYRSFVVTLNYTFKGGNTKKRAPKRNIENDDQDEIELNIFK